MVEFEYEYHAPNKGYRPFNSRLPSAYDDDSIPAGIRGEAVRAAIRSGRCICWDLGGTPLQQGWISMKGAGTLNFLNSKLSQSFSWNKKHNGGESNYKDACLLNTKGRIIDRLGIALFAENHAYILTSPGHAGSLLFNRLDPLIFPLDQVELSDFSDKSKIITIASTKIEDVQCTIEKYIIPLLESSIKFTFQKEGKDCARIELDSGASLNILPTAILPETALVGYTLVVEDDTDNLYQQLWGELTSEESVNGPIKIGALEFETLRIEGGMPAFNKELTASYKNPKRTPAGPFELHCGGSLVDMEKGCYLGQEGVASVVRNSRGPPRLLYQIVFDYDNNVFDSESKGDKGGIENFTKLPAAEDDLFVLGSNNKISVGTLTSIAEPGGTGDPCLVGLALVKRADKILKAMNDCGLEIDRNVGKDPFADDPLWNGGNTAAASAMVDPPPMDPLDGLEVIVKGSYTIGTLRCIPSRRYPMGQNMFEDVVFSDVSEPKEGEIEVEYVKGGWTPEIETDIFVDQPSTRQNDVNDSNTKENDASDNVGAERPKKGIQGLSTEEEKEQAEINRAIEEASKAQAAADAAAAEAKRKEAKLAMLKKKAEEAMLRREAKRKEATEAKRKEEKIALLKKRAEEAMARRKGKGTIGSATTSKSKDAPSSEIEGLSPKEAEAKRKAEKMEMLRKRAEEAMARRKAKKKENE